MLAAFALLAVGLAEAVPLWPEGSVPDFRPEQIAARLEVAEQAGFDAATHRMPHLRWYGAPARNRTGQCVILISGGGYVNLCDGVWVDRFADYLTARGVQCVALNYRTSRPKGLPIYQTAWEDGQRAVRLVRSEAKRRGYDPERIGVLGFSAGGHLSVLLATSSQTPAYPRVDALDDVPCHVNFAVPVFPAYVLSDGLEGPNKAKGDAPDVTLNPCFKFDAKTCPMCLVHGSDDIYSSVGSVRIYQKLHAMGVSSDLHVYAGRGHGFMRDNALLRFLDGWIDRVGDFLDGDRPTLTDEAWRRLKAEALARPRRIIVDDDGCDATTFPEKKEQTIENFYAQMLGSMVGNEFDVLTYCPCTTGLAVANRTKTGHRALASLVDLHYTNITETLDREFGTDPLRLAHDFARSNGYEFVINMRANDAHDAFYPVMLSDYKRRHPEFLVGTADRRPPFGEWSAFDFAVPEVRALFKTLVCEWIDEYDPDGIMIDFHSHCLFKSVAWGGRPSPDEMDAYTGMVREIREYAEKAGRRRRRPVLFQFRIPDSIPLCRLMGIDIVRWADERLFDLCIAGSDGGHYGLWRDMAGFCREKGLKFYPSVDISWMKPSPELFRRNCPEGFTGQIAAAFASGADGIYLFNMFYAKGYFPRIRRDPAALATYDKRYFVTAHAPRRVSAFQPPEGGDGLRAALYPEYPLVLSGRERHDYAIEVGDDFAALPADGSQPTVRLHLKCSAERGEGLDVALNGVELGAVTSSDSVVTYPVDPKNVLKGANVLTLAAAGDVKPARERILAGDALIGPANRRKWRRLFPGNAAKGSESIVDGAYRLATTDGGPVNLLYPLGNGCGQLLEAEFDLRVEPGSQPGSVAARLGNGIGIEVFDFMPGRVRLRYAAHQCAFDTERFHRYRVRIDGGAVELWADGRLVLSGDVGKNASNVRCHLRGQHYRVAGMDESSFLIGAVDPAAGAGHWKDVSLVTSALAVGDAMLEVSFSAGSPVRKDKEGGE